MKVLVTGATGFLGRSLVARLLARGESEVRCFARAGSDTAPLEALARAHPEARVECVVASLGSPAGAAKALEEVDTVYHLAASLGGTPADIFLGTVVASKNLLEAIVASGRRIKVVLVSSFGVYGVAGLQRRTVIDESTPLEEHPEWRDVYSHAKLRQELLFREYQARHGFPLVVLRPGVIYGPDGSRYSARVGLDLAGIFLFLGGGNTLPLTFVENCADALVVAGRDPTAEGQTYNVVDDALVTARQYLRRYRAEVGPLKVLPVPYPALQLLSRMVQGYSRWSKGQLPPVFTPYKTATSWKPTRFTNARLRSLGWSPRVTTDDGLRRTFTHFRQNPR